MSIAFPKFILAGLACCGLALAAEPPVPALHLGVVEAQGDFRNEIGSKHALDTALSLSIPLTRTLAIRPLVAFQGFTTLANQYSYKSTRYSDLGTESKRWSAWTFGADCLYRPSGPQGRFYLLAGAAMKVWRLHSFGTYSTSDRVNPTRIYNVDDTSTKNEPALAVGLGYTLHRRVSLESRMVLGSYRGLSFNTLQAAVVLSY
jgi:hypothetical protein